MQAPAGLGPGQSQQDGHGHRVHHGVAHRNAHRAPQGLTLAAGVGALSRHLQLQHQRGRGQQDQGVQRNQGEQQHLPGLAIGQPDQRHTDHQGVAEDAGQRQHRGPAVSPVHPEHGGKQQTGHEEILRHRRKVQRLDAHLTHGAKQQRLREHQKHQVGQVAHRLGPHQPRTAGHHADADQEHHRQQRRQDRVVKVHTLNYPDPSALGPQASCPMHRRGRMRPVAASKTDLHAQLETAPRQR